MNVQLLRFCRWNFATEFCHWNIEVQFCCLKIALNFSCFVIRSSNVNITLWLSSNSMIIIQCKYIWRCVYVQILWVYLIQDNLSPYFPLLYTEEVPTPSLVLSTLLLISKLHTKWRRSSASWLTMAIEKAQLYTTRDPACSFRKCSMWPGRMTGVFRFPEFQKKMRIWGRTAQPV